MTSEERHEARYQRRKAARLERKRKATKDYDNFDAVFTYEHLCNAYKSSRCGVSWKASVQKFIAIAPLRTVQILDDLRDGSYRSSGFYEFDIHERGKLRHIRSVKFDERIVQRCLCDYALTPMFSRRLIYDNGASTVNKGYTFAVNRLEGHLRDYIRKNGTDGYVLVYDFSKYFDSISHEYIKGILENNFEDEKLKKLMFHFIDAFGDVGLGLGSQISQNLALVAADEIDHYIKDKLGIKWYGRYMDDGYIIGSKEELKKVYAEISQLAAKCGLKFNQNKTQIVKLRHGFSWLHVKFIITETGKIVKVINHDSVVRCRRRIKAFRRKLDRGEMSLNSIQESITSWMGYAATFKSYRTRLRMQKLFNELFSEKGCCINVLQDYNQYGVCA